MPKKAANDAPNTVNSNVIGKKRRPTVQRPAADVNRVADDRSVVEHEIRRATSQQSRRARVNSGSRVGFCPKRSDSPCEREGSVAVHLPIPCGVRLVCRGEQRFALLEFGQQAIRWYRLLRCAMSALPLGLVDQLP